MFKLCFFLWRRSDFSSSQFSDYYEHDHAPLGLSLGPPLPDYRRNYFEWANGAPSEALSFDVMTELWHKNRAAFSNQLAIMTRSPAKETISEDEARFMNRDRQLFLALDERISFGTAEPQNTAMPNAQNKVVRFVKSAAGLTAAEFRDGYETEVALRTPSSSDGLIEYRRNYALLDDEYSFSGGAQNILPIDPRATVFDMIEEFWFAGAVNSSVLDELNERGSELGLIDPDRTHDCPVAEYRSPTGPPAAPVATRVRNLTAPADA